MTNPNDPVTPHLTYNQESGHANGFVDGLTKREYFAAMAMQGLLANTDLTKTDDIIIAMTAIDASDALISALNTTTQ